MTEKMQQYYDLMKDVEENILTYIDENNQKSFFNYLNEQKIAENKQIFKSFLYILVHISNNYHRTKNFYDKIDQILIKYKISIQTFYKNSEIFHIFKSNKRILLFLKEEKILNFDEFIVRQIIHNHYINYKYPQYFQPEIEQFKNEIWFPEYNEVYKFNSWILDNQKEIPDDSGDFPHSASVCPESW